MSTDRHAFPGGNLILWKDQEEGTTFEGTFVAEHPGPFGYHYDLQDEITGDVITLSSATVLDRRMAFLLIGTYVIVEFKGKQPSKRPGGSSFFDFATFTRNAADWLKQPRRAVNGAKKA